MLNASSFARIRAAVDEAGLGERLKAFEEHIRESMKEDPIWSRISAERQRAAMSFLVFGFCYGVYCMREKRAPNS